MLYLKSLSMILRFFKCYKKRRTKFKIIFFRNKLWWPNGMGEQYLYDFNAEIQFNNTLSSSDQKLDSKQFIC